MFSLALLWSISSDLCWVIDLGLLEDMGPVGRTYRYRQRDTYSEIEGKLPRPHNQYDEIICDRTFTKNVDNKAAIKALLKEHMEKNEEAKQKASDARHEVEEQARYQKEVQNRLEQVERDYRGTPDDLTKEKEEWQYFGHKTYAADRSKTKSQPT